MPPSYKRKLRYSDAQFPMYVPSLPSTCRRGAPSLRPPLRSLWISITIIPPNYSLKSGCPGVPLPVCVLSLPSICEVAVLLLHSRLWISIIPPNYSLKSGCPGVPLPVCVPNRIELVLQMEVLTRKTPYCGDYLNNHSVSQCPLP